MCNKTEVAVGLSISVTGRFLLQGRQALQGIRLWQSYVDAQGGIAVGNGEQKSVRLIWYDDRSQIGIARKNVLKLLREDKIDILLGPYSSSLTMAVTEIAEEYKKVLWNHGGSSDEIFHHGSRYLVGIANPASDYLRVLPDWLAEEHPELARICVLYPGRGTFGWQVARGILGRGSDCGPPRRPSRPRQRSLGRPRHHSRRSSRDRSRSRGSGRELSGRGKHPANTRSLAQHGTCRGGSCGRIGAFSAELGQLADGVLGPSQWEPGTTFPNIVGPTSDWFVESFQRQFHRAPEYIAAGSFVTGLVLTECIQRAASLNDEELRNTASNLDCNTFYGRFRVDSRNGMQTGHRVLLICWQGGRKTVLSSPSK